MKRKHIVVLLAVFVFTATGLGQGVADAAPADRLAISFLVVTRVLAGPDSSIDTVERRHAQ